MSKNHSWQTRVFCVGLPLLTLLASLAGVSQGQPLERQPLVFNVQESNDRLEMTVNTSRILTMGMKIPQAQVNNPNILELTPLSPTQIQVMAKAPGVTQVNLWDENEQIRTLDVIVYGDAQELAMVLHSQFPKSSLKVVPLANSVIIQGYVDRPDIVPRIIQIAEDYHPRVINNMTVAGVQQVLLHVKLMEVSRTKLRALGVDWFADINGHALIASGVSGLLASSDGGFVTTGGETLSGAVISGDTAILGVLEALYQNDMMSILAEPDLVAVSGRPASFTVGGEFPILVPQSLGTTSIEFKKYGTQLDFVPIVLGNGRIRLELRPRVSEIDKTRGVLIPGSETTVPALTVREAETGVEMQAGQTLAIAGLLQKRSETQVRGIPFFGQLPYVGALFRRTESRENEVELLILVTPEFVDAMDCHEVPPGGPGLNSCLPNDHQLYWKGHIEVPCGNGCSVCPQTGTTGEILLPGHGDHHAPRIQPTPAGQAFSSDSDFEPIGEAPEMLPSLPRVDQSPESEGAPVIEALPSKDYEQDPLTYSGRRTPTQRDVTQPVVQPITRLETPRLSGPDGSLAAPTMAPLAPPVPNGMPNLAPPQAAPSMAGEPPMPQDINLPQRASAQRQYGAMSTVSQPRPAQPQSPAELSPPGLIGPIGYDVQK